MLKSINFFSLLLIFSFFSITFTACGGCGGRGGGRGGGGSDGISEDKVVTIADIPDIIAPVRGERPVTEIETSQYIGFIDWMPKHNFFEAEKVYTAHIYLIEKDEFTFQGVAANFFKVAGADSVTNNADSGDVTAVFPATGSPFIGEKETYEAEGVSFKMVYVPGGFTFPTGENDGGTATVDNAYWIGETQVTYELWEKVYDWATSGIGARAYTFANAGQMGSGGSSGSGMTDQHPVTMIYWRDSMVWCNALTEWYNDNSGTDYECVYYEDSD